MECSWKSIRQKAFEIRHERIFRGEDTRLKYMYFPAPNTPQAANILLVDSRGVTIGRHDTTMSVPAVSFRFIGFLSRMISPPTVGEVTIWVNMANTM